MATELADCYDDIAPAEGVLETSSERPATTRVDYSQNDLTQSKPQDLLQSTIQVQTLMPENERTSYLHRPVLGMDYDSIAPVSLDLNYLRYSWSPPGLGPLGSCLLAVVDSDLDLNILHAEKNAFKGPWTLAQSLDLNLGWTEDSMKPGSQRFRTLGTQVLDADWSPMVTTEDGQRCSILAASTRSGEVVFWSLTRSRTNGNTLDGTQTIFRVKVAAFAVNQITWDACFEQQSVPGKARFTLLCVDPRSGPFALSVSLTPNGSVSEVCHYLKPEPPPDKPQIGLLRLLPRSPEWRECDHGIIITTPGQVRIWLGALAEAKSDSGREIQFSSASSDHQHSPSGGEWFIFNLSPVSLDSMDASRAYSRDSHSVAVALDFEQQAHGAAGLCAIVTLASGLRYRIPFGASMARGGKGSSIAYPLPRLASTVRRKNLILEGLEQQVEAIQSVGAWSSLQNDIDGSTITPSSLITTVLAAQSDDEIAAYRVLTHHVNKLTFLLSLPAGRGHALSATSNAQALYISAIEQGLAGEDPSHVHSTGIETSIQAFQPALAIYHSSLTVAERRSKGSTSPLNSTREALLNILTDACERAELAWSKEGADGASHGQSNPATRHKAIRRKRLYWLALWALEQSNTSHQATAKSKEAVTSSSTARLRARLSRLELRSRARLIVSYLVSFLDDVDEASKQSQSRRDLLISVSRMVLAALHQYEDNLSDEPEANVSSEGNRAISGNRLWLSECIKSLDKALKARMQKDALSRASEQIDLGEQCPACQQPILLEAELLPKEEEGEASRGGTASMNKGQPHDSTNESKPAPTIGIPKYARCQGAGHVWRRCGKTFAVLATADVKTCVGCRLKVQIQSNRGDDYTALTTQSKVGAQGRPSSGKRKRAPDESPSDERPRSSGGRGDEVEGDDHCHMCGNVWIQLG